MRLIGCILIMLTAVTVCAQRPLDSLYTRLENYSTDDSAKVELLFQLCLQEFRSGHKENALPLIKEALAISEKIKFTKGVATSYNYLALYYQAVGDFDKVADNTMRMIEVYEKLNDQAGLTRAYNMLALVHQQWKNYDRAEVYLKKAVAINTQVNHQPGLMVNYMNLGVTFALAGKYDSAILYFENALMLSQYLNDENEMTNAYANIGYAYAHKSNFVKAIQNFDKAYPLAQKNNNLLSLFEINVGYLKIDTSAHDYQKAILHAEGALVLAERIADKTRLHEAYQWLSEIEHHRDNHQNAFKYLALAQAYKDSIFTEVKALTIAELETRYETEKKERTIQLLSKDRKIQLLWTNLLVVGMVIITVASIVIYTLQRKHQRKNLAMLNMQIDLLTSGQQHWSDKYHDAISASTIGLVESSDQRLLRNALEVVERNMANPLFGVDKMADDMAMSRANLHRKLKTVTGLVPGDFIRNVRMKRAAYLLQNNADTVAQIALSVGFEYQSNFSKVFKKQFGVSPSEFSKSEHVTL